MVRLILLTIVAALATAKNIIGVAPEDQHLYEPRSDGKWSCLSDPSIMISQDQINDDICDCPDGSDEPGTAACESRREDSKGFYCANEGYFPGYIQHYKVNDGVCDYDTCCDGSDEWATGKCPNKCDIVRQKFDKYVAERKADIEKALRIRNQLVKKAERAKAEVGKELEKIREEIFDLSAKLEKERKNLQRTKAQTSREGSSDRYESNEASKQISRLEKYFESSIASEMKSQGIISKLETLLGDLTENYNPNYNDAAVKNCVREFREYISGKEDDKDSQEMSFEDAKELLKRLTISTPSEQSHITIVPTFDNMVHYYFSKLINSFRPQPKEEVAQPKSEATKSNVEVEIEATIAKLEKELRSKQSEASIYEENILQQFGKDDIYRAMKGEWISRKIGEYNYKIGYLDSIYQDNTLIGHLTSVDQSTLHFTQGAKCWNGPQRSASVDLICASKSRIVSVSEPEKCHYRFLLETPIVCEAISDEEIAKEFKIEASEL